MFGPEDRSVNLLKADAVEDCNESGAVFERRLAADHRSALLRKAWWR